MIVRLAFAALAFAAPLAVYALYARFFGKDRHAPAPGTVWMIATLLAVGSFLAPALLEPRGDGRFEPAHLENGVLVPDRVVR
ncbi:MAG: hypothetical protein ABUS57_16980 [Pseudomonadota bacterium]